MRKAQKQQAEDFVKLLGQAHDEIKKAIEKKNISAAMSLLADCQDGAIALGELIEKAEGEGFSTIALLESYCEQVFRLYEELEKGQPVGAGKASKNLRQMLFKIESSVRNDIRIRREAVFLPYKASMWDSLESIWKAADEDPDCDAYVVPIPYYDKNPDGSFKELHYEGGEYPKNVPVVWYEDYDFEKRRPDMVFIHNPYDDCNLVTSVHPFFYSNNLKKFTDKLVYVPYFILGEIDPQDRQALKGIEKFCLVPGVAYADQVIVQSEDMRQAYINVLTEFMSGQGRSREYWEKKILGLGSPKVDKVLNTRKEDLQIPEEWMKVIRKADGSWKKIIFYNTTVTALLQHNQQYLEKMRDVFRIFYENRDEVALLWRPHPLFASTIQSMRPELRDAYQTLVEEYRRAGWGIYDDTADMDRAVGVSDGYYGDASSAVHLYMKTGKPIMLQNIYCLLCKEMKVNCADVVGHNDNLFILTRDTQTLFAYSALSEQTKLCGAVGSVVGQFYINMTLCRNKIYIVPYEGEVISVYDIEKGMFYYIALVKVFRDTKTRHYQICFSHQGMVYMLGGIDCGMLCIDTSDDTIRNLSKWTSDFKDKYGYDVSVCTHANVCIVGHSFWVALNRNNLILQYNMKTDEYCFWEVGKKKIQYVTISYDGEYFWLSGDKKLIIRWKMETNDVKEFHDFPNGFEAGCKEIGWKELFSCGYVWKGNIYFAPLNANMLVKINLESEKMECVHMVNGNNVCLKIVEISDKGLYVEEKNNKLCYENSYYIDIDGKFTIGSLNFSTKDEVHSDRIKAGMERGVIGEAHPLYLQSFFQIIMEHGSMKIFPIYESAGQKIIANLIKK